MNAGMSQHLVETLTPRQLECLALVGSGLVAKEIARELGLSPDTVTVHIKAGMGKLGVSSRREAGRIVGLHRANPERATPIGVMAGRASIGDEEPPVADEEAPSRLMELRTEFDFKGQGGLLLPERVEPAPTSPWSRLLTTVAIAVALGVLVLMAFPLSESFQRIANLVDPPNR